MKKKRLHRSLIVLALLIAVSGTILFFPLNLDSGKTCLFHLLLSGDEDKMPQRMSSSERAHIMLRRYLSPFGYMWWLSLAILAISIYQLKKSKVQSNREHA